MESRLRITPAARRFMEKRGIEDVTFKLKVLEPAGCCLGIVKEIEPIYEAPMDASGYYYFQAEGRHVFVSRKIKLLGSLTLSTEGLWRLQRLTLSGVSIPI
jgi:hypothetical protein